MHRTPGEIHERKKHLRTVVSTAAGRPADSMPERQITFPRRAMPERIKRFELVKFSRARTGAHHVLDGEDFGGVPAAYIGHDSIFGPGLVQLDRFRGMWKEIDDRNASGAKDSRRNASLQCFPALGPLEWRNQKDDFCTIAKPCSAQTTETGEIEEKEFLREAEIFHQEPIAGEAAPRERQHALVFLEADST